MIASIGRLILPPAAARRWKARKSLSVVIVEVLSKTAAAHDREVKLPDYQRMPSVAEVLLIYQDRVLVEVYRRPNPEDGVWQRVDLDRLDEVVVLRGHGIE